MRTELYLYFIHSRMLQNYVWLIEKAARRGHFWLLVLPELSYIVGYTNNFCKLVATEEHPTENKHGITQ